MKNIQSEHLSRSIIILFMSMMIAVLPNYSSAQNWEKVAEASKQMAKYLSYERRWKRVKLNNDIKQRQIEQKRQLIKNLIDQQFQLQQVKKGLATSGSCTLHSTFGHSLLDHSLLDQSPLDQPPSWLETYAALRASEMVKPQPGFPIENLALPLDSIDTERVYLLSKMESILSDFEKVALFKPRLINVIEDFDSFGLESYVCHNMVLSPDTQKAITEWADHAIWLCPKKNQKIDQLLSLLYLFILKNTAELNSFALTDLDPDTLCSIRLPQEHLTAIVEYIDRGTLYKVFNEMRQELNPEYYLEYPYLKYP